jgi:DNA repair protein RadC
LRAFAVHSTDLAKIVCSYNRTKIYTLQYKVDRIGDIDMGEFDGHRARVRKEVRLKGMDEWDDRRVLEFLLFYAIPRGDVNPLAHRLLDRFHDIAGIVEAPIEELMKVEGVGETTAGLLKLVPQISRRYLNARADNCDLLTSTREAAAYFTAKFVGEKTERVYVVFLDVKCRILECRLIGKGGLNSADLSIRKIVECALACNARFVVLSHNHPSGLPLPSMEDCEVTKNLMEALASVDLQLLDHIIVAGSDYMSLHDNGTLASIARNSNFALLRAM